MQKIIVFCSTLVSLFLYGEPQEMDRTILIVKKGKSQIKLNVTGGSGY